jgi:hypothetical protein
VTNLKNLSQSYTWIYFNWTNPSSDFNEGIIYIDNIWRINTSGSSYNATGLIQNTTHTITILTKDLYGNINLTGVSLNATTPASPDTTPPASIANLASLSQGYTWIYWNWTIPSDSDFSGNVIFINGMFAEFTSNNSYNATGLINNTNYTITVHTLDTNGNINNSDVNDTEKTLLIPYCGDGICNNGENCASCSSDCGSCPPTGGGGSSGGSPAGIITPIILCNENWACTKWTECSQEGIQIRVCTDSNNCKTVISKPSEIQSCEMPTCYDGIKNQDELGIDCGGPCPKRCTLNEITGSLVKVPAPAQNIKSTYGLNLLLLLLALMGIILMLSKIESRIQGQMKKEDISENKNKDKFLKKARIELIIAHIAHVIVVLGVIILIYLFVKA